MKKRGRMPDHERDRKICKLYGQGLLLKDIAERVGINPSSVGQALKRLGHERPTKPQKSVKLPSKSDLEPKIVEFWNHGLCCSQIAERLNASPSYIGSMLSKLGLLDPKNPRQRYDGIGGIGKPTRADKGAFARIASRT